MDFAKEKAKRCKYFAWSPLGTALYCNKKKIELKSVIHGKEWNGNDCLKCIKWRLKENEEYSERLRKLVIEIWCKGKCGLWDDCRKYCKIPNDPCHIVKDIEETIIEVNART